MARNAKSENTWERQPGESSKAFEAFDLYLKLGEERSIQKVAQRLSKSTTLIKGWSSRWSWVSRCRDYDNEVKRQEMQAERKAYQDMRKRQIGMAIQLQKKAFEALKNIPTEALTPKDIKEFMKLGMEMERANMSITAAEQSREESGEAIVDIYLPLKDGDDGE